MNFTNMSQQSLLLKVPSFATAKHNNTSIKNQQKSKKIVGQPVTNKFFYTSLSSSLLLKPIMNKSDKKPLQLMDHRINHSRMISSEDVSRKKLKLDEKYRKKKYSASNDCEDILENLKKKFNKKSISQPEFKNDSQSRQKSQRRRKPLFTHESLNLMNNFKKYFKDNILRNLSDGEVSRMSNTNKYSTTKNQENINNQIDTPIHNFSDLNHLFYHTSFSELRLSKPTTSTSSTILVQNNDGLCSFEANLQPREMRVPNMFLPGQIVDLSLKSRTTMLNNINDHTNQLSSSEVFEVNTSFFRYSHHSGECNNNNSSVLTYF